MKRKIAAILAADIAGYSRLVAEDEEETLHRLGIYRAVFEDFVARYGGRIFNTAGDATLAEFQSAVDAIRCAVDVQESLRTRNLAYAAGRQMSFRIGITIGDVVERDGDLLGDGVNIASRLEGMAPAGGICISRAVHEAVSSKISLKFDDLGWLQLKNIPERVHAYTVALAQSGKVPAHSPMDWRVLGLAAVLMIAVTGVGVYVFTRSLLPLWSSSEIGAAGPQIVAAEQAKTAASQAVPGTPTAPTSPTAEKRGDDLAKLPIERQSLRVKLGRSPQEGMKPRGLLGVRVVDLGSSLAKVLGAGEPKSAWVIDWFENGPAEAAGIRIGDILLNIDGRAPKDARDFIRTVGEHSPGSDVTLEIARSGDGAADLLRRVSDRAQADDAQAVTALGRLREFGVGGSKSESEAKRLYERGAALGSEDAKIYLAYLYHKDRAAGAEGMSWIRAAAEADDIDMINALGFRYWEGVGVAKDQAEAIRWYRRAAELGSTAAMTFLGSCYANGAGVPRDDQEAVSWFRKSAEGGDPAGMVALGLAYQLGQGVTANDDAAARWFRSAAEDNDARGMLNFGLMLHRGQGVEKDEDQAARLVRMALRSGDPALAEYVMTNAERMTVDDRKWLQTQLRELGVYSAPIDGEFGDTLKVALRDASRIAGAPATPSAVAPSPPAAPEPREKADNECRKYLPSIGRTVEVPCEGTQEVSKSGDVAAKRQWERYSLRATLGRFPGDGLAPRGWLGVVISNLPPPLAKDMAAPQGVLIDRMAADSPAERAGVRSGDVLLTIDGRKPATSRDLAQIVASWAPGSEVTLEIARFGQGSADLMRALRERADAGSSDAMMALGALLQTEVGGVKDEAEAARWYRKAADLGNAEAMFNLGVIYEGGRGVSKDEAEAARWYRKAADVGDPGAMLSLGDLYGSGRGVAKDETEAVRWYRKAAELGQPRAMALLGVAYGDGQGVAKDEAEAVRWFRKAADMGLPFAMHNLGVSYRDGRGVAKDEAEAARWFRKAAELGEASAMTALGALYRDGSGVPKDYTEAVRWFRMGANAGDPSSMTNLGVHYHNGWGVEQDPEQAAEFVLQALQTGDARTAEWVTAESDWSVAFGRALQRRLKQERVFDGPIDGIFGPATVRAIKDLASRG
ncbi:MAG: PDZ domain-containing protein [Hyphomicrobium sp.]|nr:MAG: PDZ domain-containing protein [Hyphomicrobium sp.]MBZ0210953.1 PDZ domain-containing protein [Hyphomicrobium sp.]